MLSWRSAIRILNLSLEAASVDAKLGPLMGVANVLLIEFSHTGTYAYTTVALEGASFERLTVSGPSIRLPGSGSTGRELGAFDFFLEGSQLTIEASFNWVLEDTDSASLLENAVLAEGTKN